MSVTFLKRFLTVVLIFTALLLLHLSFDSDSQTMTAEAGSGFQSYSVSGAASGNHFGDCSNTGTGLIPLNDLLGGTHQSSPGGLYPDNNSVPQAHLQVGLAAGQAVERLNQQGQPNNRGKIVFMSLGMSNAKQEFAQFMKLARTEKSPGIVLMNSAQGSYDAPTMADPNSNYWPLIDARLAQKNLSPLQVQVIWINQATAHETAQFPQDAQNLQGYLRDIVLIVEDRFPNVQAIYFSSRVYGGYAAADSSSPEPWAYQAGFAVKWLIADQINGSDPALAYDNTPWLAWGPYLWADGLNPRADGLIWNCDDFESDGTHPAPSGELKVANMLLDFFLNDPTTQWFPRN